MILLDVLPATCCRGLAIPQVRWVTSADVWCPLHRTALEQDGGGGREKALAFAVEELGLLTSNLAKTLKVEGFHMLGHGFGAEVT